MPQSVESWQHLRPARLELKEMADAEGRVLALVVEQD